MKDRSAGADMHTAGSKGIVFDLDSIKVVGVVW